MTPPQRNRGWIWYFALLAILTAISLTILIRYNLAHQLTLEKLAIAHALWEKNAPANYDLEYTQNGSMPETRKVRVRNRKVVWGVRDGQPLEERLYSFSDMDAWFGFLEDNLKNDASPGKPRTYTVASFDPSDGHITHYVRRVMGTTERVEVTFKLEPVSGT